MEKLEETMIEVNGAYKSYDSRKFVLNGLNMKVEKGIIYALLGPSGCGKTTLLQSIVGRKSLAAGEISLGVKNRSQIGFMPQEMALVREMSIKETLHYYGWMYHLRGSKLEERKMFLYKFLEIPPEDRLIKELSGGQKRRVSLCVALLHDPELMILDEPTVGIDPVLSASIWQYLIEITMDKTKTILLTTHYIEEARHSAKVGMMRQGVLVAEGPPLSIMASHESNTLEEVFIKLSNEQEMRLKEDEEKPKEFLKKLKQSEKPQLPLKDETFLSLHNVYAYLLKSTYHLKNSPGTLLLIFLLPVFTCLIFEYSIGHHPNSLKLGIINDELIYNGASCHNFSNSTCFPASCDFLNLLKQRVDIVNYNDVNSARRGVETNQITGYLVFSRNFTQSLTQRIELHSSTPDEDLEQSEILVWMDMTNFIITNYLKSDIYLTYVSFLDKLSDKCGWIVRHDKLPIQLKEPVYGKTEPDFSDFSVNAIILLLEFFIPVGYGIIILEDKNNGVLERNLTSGLNYLEMLLGHIIVTMVLFVIQTCFIFVIIYGIYNHIFEGSLILALALALLVGISGMWFGLFTALLCPDDLTATYFGIGFYMIVVDISGMFWPTEGIHQIIRSVNWLLPLTYATEALRCISAKSSTLSHPVVYKGFLMLLMWTGGLMVISWVLVKIRKKI